jgi:hypothetical protein
VGDAAQQRGAARAFAGANVRENPRAACVPVAGATARMMLPKAGNHGCYQRPEYGLATPEREIACVGGAVFRDLGDAFDVQELGGAGREA